MVMYGCESWTVKKAENWKIDAFELWCWRRVLRVPWTARRSNQSILKEINHGISLEGMTLKLKLQYFGHLMRRVDSLEKTLMLGEIAGRRRRGQPRMRWLDGITDSMESEWTPGDGDGQGGLACCDSWGRKELDTTEGLNWTELNWIVIKQLLGGGEPCRCIPCIILKCPHINLWGSCLSDPYFISEETKSASGIVTWTKLYILLFKSKEYNCRT